LSFIFDDDNTKSGLKLLWAQPRHIACIATQEVFVPKDICSKTRRETNRGRGGGRGGRGRGGGRGGGGKELPRERWAKGIKADHGRAKVSQLEIARRRESCRGRRRRER
jgi:hypothetical protein